MDGIKPLIILLVATAGAIAPARSATAQCRLCDQPTAARADGAEDDGIQLQIETDLEFDRRAMKAAGKRPALLILDHQLPEDFCAEHRITLLTYIAGSLAPFEEYAIHLAQPVAATDPVLDKP